MRWFYSLATALVHRRLLLEAGLALQEAAVLSATVAAKLATSPAIVPIVAPEEVEEEEDMNPAADLAVVQERPGKLLPTGFYSNVPDGWGTSSVTAIPAEV